MTHVYLAQWIWQTPAGETPFWRPPRLAVHSGTIDLRTRAQAGAVGPVPTGFAVFSFSEAVSIPGAILMGTNVHAPMRAGAADAIKTAMGLATDLAGDTLAEAIYELLTTHADSSGVTGPMPLMPTLKGDMEVHLGGFSRLISRRLVPGVSAEWPKVLEVIREGYRGIRAKALGRPPEDARGRRNHRRHLGWLVAKYRVDWRTMIPADLPAESPDAFESTVADDFDRGNAATLGANWTEGQAGAISNNLGGVTTREGDGQFWAYHNTALSGSDMTAEAVVLTAGFGGKHIAVGVRVIGEDNFYSASAKDDTIYFRKRVAGVFSDLGSDASWSSGAVAKGSINGSAFESFVNGVSKVSGTDMSHPSETSAGLAADNDDSEQWNNWEASDIEAAAAPPGPSMAARMAAAGLI